jgi:hypothetical protein
LIFIVTLYKNADGSFEKKEYSVKAQAVEGGAGTGKDPKLATYAKTTIDFSEHARLEHSARGETVALPLDNKASKAKGVRCELDVSVTWLRNYVRDADGMTDISGVSGYSTGVGGGMTSGASDITGLTSVLSESEQDLGAFYTLVPIRPRWRGERRSLRTLPGASLRPHLAFNPRPRCLSTPTDAYELHPDNRLYGTTLSRVRRPRRVAGVAGVAAKQDAGSRRPPRSPAVGVIAHRGVPHGGGRAVAGQGGAHADVGRGRGDVGSVDAARSRVAVAAAAARARGSVQTRGDGRRRRR